jgi:hypothetical protein
MQDQYDDWVNMLEPINRAADMLVEYGADPAAAAEAKLKPQVYVGGFRGKVEYALHKAPTNLKGDDIAGVKPMSEILRPIKDIREFDTYLVSKRVVEKRAQGIKTGVDREDALAVIRQLEGKYEPARRELREFQRTQLNLLVESGILSPADAGKMEATNEMYVPFYRYTEAMAGGGRAGAGRGFINLGRGVKPMKGSDREILSPVQSIIRNAFVFRDLAERSVVAKTFMTLVDETRGGGRIGDQVAKKVVATKLTPDEVVQMLEKAGILEDVAGMVDAEPYQIAKTMGEMLAQNKGALKVWRAATTMDPKRGILRVWRGGEEQHFQIDDPELYRALSLAAPPAPLPGSSVRPRSRTVNPPVGWLAISNIWSGDSFWPRLRIHCAACF